MSKVRFSAGHALMRNNLGKIIHNRAHLSPSSMSRYWRAVAKAPVRAESNGSWVYMT